MRGKIHIYTGNGKGKTTAAIGLALRSAGAGKEIFIGQFVKSQIYSEIDFINNNIPQIKTAQYGLDCFIINEPTKEDVFAAKEGLADIKDKIHSSKYDLIILDEINIAFYYNLFSVEEFISILKSKPSSCEIVLTGRYAPKELIDLAGLVTEMQEVKHYYKEGIEARKGIEY